MLRTPDMPPSQMAQALRFPAFLRQLGEGDKGR